MYGSATGKNRCVNENGIAPCKRCAASGTPCVFETSAPSKHYDEERLERLEKSMGGLQSTVESLLGFLRSSSGAPHSSSHLPSPPAARTTAAQPPSLPSFDPNSFQTHPHSNGVALPALDLQPQVAMRLDADFNARSPANPLHWDVNLAGTSLAHTYNLYSNAPTAGTASEAQQQAVRRASAPLAPTPVIQQQRGHVHGPAGHHVSFQSPESTDSFNSSMATTPAGAAAAANGANGLVPSNVPSDDEDALPTSSLTAPFEALAEAAAAAASGSGSVTPVPGHLGTSGIPAGRKRKKRRRVAPPPNAFPDVITKGLISEPVAREMFDFYFANCNKFFPILDPAFDTFTSMRSRTPWSTDAVISAAANRVPNPSREIVQAAEHATEETHGIARSSLFGPTVRKEGVQAMALAAAFADNGYLAAGHALRMGYELGLYRALKKLESRGADDVQSQEEEEELMISARLFLGLTWLDFVLSDGSGRPHLVDEELVSADKLASMLKHPLSIDSDKLLVAIIELIAVRTRIERGFGVAIESRAFEFARRASKDLSAWYKKWDNVLAEKFVDTSFERKSLLSQYYLTLIFLSTRTLKGTHITDVASLSAEHRETALEARQAAQDVIELWLNTPSLRDALRYATQSTFVDVAFSALLLLKLSRLFPEGGVESVVQQCHQLSLVLCEFPRAERYHMTLRIALERFSKAFSIDLPQPTPDFSAFPSDDALMSSNTMYNSYPSFDVPSLPVFSDQNWVGNETVPDWLSNPSSWTFDSFDMSEGLDKIFLPAWSTQMDSYMGGEW
ncbi:hypothetical protein MNV49_000610 [Pseudohyphozyma bogoriensis]|nr:hypothetical protein MNV49_000610 [Pseudohyphozyma bogoriensis]